MKIRKAWREDLPQLKTMFDKIVAKMQSEGLNIWCEAYPYEEFENDILGGHLYVITDDETIVATLCLVDDVEGSDCFEWEDKTARAYYFTRIGVNVDYLRRGVGITVIKYAKFLARENGRDYIRLTIVDNNIPAINLYTKNNFKQVAGENRFHSDLLDADLCELGYEYKI